MKRTAIILMMLTVGSKIFGFFRDITLSYFYGTSNISDAYLISESIPMSILEFVGLGLLTGYIPIYNIIMKRGGLEETKKFTNNVINLTIIISSILILIGVAFTKDLVKVFAIGFEGETLNLAIEFTKISLFSIYFVTLGYIFRGLLQVRENYVIPAITGFPLNVIIILSILISVKTNAMILAKGSLLASASQLLILIPFAYKEGYRYKPYLNINDKYIKELWSLAVPMILGISVNQMNVIVDKTVASIIVEGGISALNYANRLNYSVQGIFVLSISTVLYPMISKMAADDNIDGLKRSVSEAINSINLLIIPITVGAMIFAEPIVEFLFGRGAFDGNAISMTTDALFFYSIGMIGIGLREVLSRAFYSLKDTKTPMKNAVLSMIINIFLNIILSRYMGISGLALATSISALFCTGLLFIGLRKKVGSFGFKGISITSMKIIIVSLVMGVIAKLSYNILERVMSENLSLLASICIGGGFYFIIILFMKIKEVDAMIYIVKKKMKVIK